MVVVVDVVALTVVCIGVSVVVVAGVTVFAVTTEWKLNEIGVKFSMFRKVSTLKQSNFLPV